jgi:hypothetical protein
LAVPIAQRERGEGSARRLALIDVGDEQRILHAIADDQS